MPWWESCVAGTGVWGLRGLGGTAGRMKIEWSEDMRVVKRWNESASAWAEFSSNSSCAWTCD